MQLDISIRLTPQTTTIICHHMKKVLLKKRKKKVYWIRELKTQHSVVRPRHLSQTGQLGS